MVMFNHERIAFKFHIKEIETIDPIPFKIHFLYLLSLIENLLPFKIKLQLRLFD